MCYYTNQIVFGPSFVPLTQMISLIQLCYQVFIKNIDLDH